MTRDLRMKLLPLIFGICALLAISACAVAGWSQDATDEVENEPTVVPTATATQPPSTPPEPEATQPSEDEATPTPESSSIDGAIVSPEDARIVDIDPDRDASEQSDDGSEEVTDAEEANPAPATPARLQIDRLGVDAGFEYVGVNARGNMDAPEGWDNIAWYEPGTIPGHQGNAVVTGHYDRPGGDPAIFFELRNLQVGDRITIVTVESEELVFEVTEIETVSAENAPLKKIFGDTDQHNLNLITCEGAWDPEAGMYDHRLVVYSTLVE